MSNITALLTPVMPESRVRYLARNHGADAYLATPKGLERKGQQVDPDDVIYPKEPA